MSRLIASESDPSVQEQIFKTLLHTPHRSVDEVLSIHHDQMERDPFLYGCLAVYAVMKERSVVRDIQDVFIATLFVSKFREHREAAWVMFQDLPPFRAKRVVCYVTGYVETIKHTSQDSPLPLQGEFGFSYERAKDRNGIEIPHITKKIGRALQRRLGDIHELTIDTYLVKHIAHGHYLNRFVVSAIENYLRYRENNRSMMEGSILRAKSALKFLYAKAHLLPGKNENSWINKYLFHNIAPKGTRLAALKNLIACNDPAEQAEIIAKHKLPYPLVRSLIKAKTPSTTIASITVMTSQEILANLGMLKRDGAFDNNEVKKLIHTKIKKIKDAKKGKVDAFKGDIAAAAVSDLDNETKDLIINITDTQLKLYGQISLTTMLLIDKSASMHRAIEQGKRIASALAQAGGTNFIGCCLFDVNARIINWEKSDGDITHYSSWHKKFEMVRSGGGTDPVECLRLMIRSNININQIVIITDEGENYQGRFAHGLIDYKNKFGHIPEIVIVRLGRWACNKMETTCKEVGANVAVMECSKTDSIALPNLIQLCSKKSTFELVQEILQLPLPKREAWIAKHRVSCNPKIKKTRNPLPMGV